MALLTLHPARRQCLRRIVLLIILFNQIFNLLSSSLVYAVKQPKTKNVSKKSTLPKNTALSYPSAANDPLAFEPYGKNIFHVVGGGLNAAAASFLYPDKPDADSSEVDPSSLARCFCPSAAVVDDCSCTVESVDRFNHEQLQPILSQLLVKPFFRYYKVNINRECPFWTDHSQCTMRDCGLSSCSSDELPLSFRWSTKQNDMHAHAEAAMRQAALDQAKSGSEPATCQEIDDLGAVDADIGMQQRQDMARWAQHSAQSAAEFCVAEDESCPDAEYIDLLKNPERYTGYRGESAWKVWRSIYRENCFGFNDGKTTASNNSNNSKSWPVDLSMHLRDMCMEKRTFYRLISGLHSSINIHLSANYLFETAQFKPNLKEFHRRFNAELTHGQGPLWLTNLYFAYLVELRALQKAAPLLRQYSFYTGIDDEDVQVRHLINQLLEVIDTFNAHFDESLLFNGISSRNNNMLAGGNTTANNSMPFTSLWNNNDRDRNDNNVAVVQKHAQALFDEFRSHFQNVSRIMDCVGCDKCRLWGKLQIQGMGTALRILFHDLMVEKMQQPPNGGKPPPLQLRRNEIIALVNAFGRLSSSIEHLWTFRAMVESAAAAAAGIAAVKDDAVEKVLPLENASSNVEIESVNDAESPPLVVGAQAEPHVWDKCLEFACNLRDSTWGMCVVIFLSSVLACGLCAYRRMR